MAKSQFLRPAEEAVQGHDRFKRSFQGFFKGKPTRMQLTTTKEKLEQQVLSCEQDFSTQRNFAFDATSRAADVHNKYQEDRATGVKKVGRITQKFFTTFAEFLRAYSGIVELLKGAGQGYGEVAYGTLSIFLIV